MQLKKGIGLKRPFGSKQQPSGDMPLNITSMADIFTILLVFLLKSYATSAVNITPTGGLKLPVGQAETQQVEAMKVEISQTGIVLETQPVLELKEGRIPASELLQNGASKTLSSAIEKARQKQVDQSQNNTDVKVDSKIVVIADEKTPYATIKSVLASAAIHGFTDFKLAVVNRN